MRALRFVVGLLVASATILVPVGPPASGATRLNLVLILTDDMRAVDLNYMPQTQTLLAGHGITFTNAYVGTSLCCPSRSSILTGQYSHNTGVLDNAPPNGGVTAFDDSSTLATWLHDAGYTTSMWGKYLNGYETLSETFVPPGWDGWNVIATGTKPPVYYNYTLNQNGVLKSYGSAPSEYLTDVLAKGAYRFVRLAQAPFFLAFHPFAPHYPATPGPTDVVPSTPLPRPPSFDEADVTDKPWGATTPPLTTDWIDRITAYHRNAIASVQSVDRAVALIVQGLQERGVLENTVIAFTSDNGMMLGEHRIWNKIWPYEPSVRVPMVFRLPGSPYAQKRVDSRFVMNVDLAATFAGFAGITPGLPQDGKSLIPLLALQKGLKWRPGVFLEWRGALSGFWMPTPYRAYRAARHKLIIWDDGSRELYDLLLDPHELNNVAGDPSYDAVEAGLEQLLREQEAA